MATYRRPGQVIQKEQWGTLAGSPTYGKYLLEAREAWVLGMRVTEADIRAAYARAARAVMLAINNLPATYSLARRTLLESVWESLRTATLQMNREVFDALTKGINLSVIHGTTAPHRLLMSTLGGRLGVDGIEAMFASVNQQATLAVLNKTMGPQGLKVSDRIWQGTQVAQNNLRTLITNGVAEGMDARRLARLVEPWANQSALSLMKPETARRLGVPRSLSYQALRLARTELTNAFREGTYMGNRATPSYKGIYWRLSASHPVADICDDLAQGEKNDGSGFWPAGREPNTPHPNCFCPVIPAHQDLDSLVDDLQAWLQDPTSQPTWETWYQEVARPFISLPGR